MIEICTHIIIVHYRVIQERVYETIVNNFSNKYAMKFVVKFSMRKKDGRKSREYIQMPII